MILNFLYGLGINKKYEIGMMKVGELVLPFKGVRGSSEGKSSNPVP